jgi:hypothetical protein
VIWLLLGGMYYSDYHKCCNPESLSGSEIYEQGQNSNLAGYNDSLNVILPCESAPILKY